MSETNKIAICVIAFLTENLIVTDIQYSCCDSYSPSHLQCYYKDLAYINAPFLHTVRVERERDKTSVIVL